jgi:hypothetical protein
MIKIMENPTNADLSRQIETVARTVAEIYAQMTTKEELSEGLSALRTEMNGRFDIVDRRLDRIEKSYDYRITTLERDVADLRT